MTEPAVPATGAATQALREAVHDAREGIERCAPAPKIFLMFVPHEPLDEPESPWTAPGHTGDADITGNQGRAGNEETVMTNATKAGVGSAPGRRGARQGRSKDQKEDAISGEDTDPWTGYRPARSREPTDRGN